MRKLLDQNILVLTLLDLATTTTWRSVYELAEFLEVDVPPGNFDVVQDMAWSLIDDFLDTKPEISPATITRLRQAGCKHFGQ